MSDDYGYFGNGDEGYAHYVAATGEDKDTQTGSGGGGHNNGGGGSNVGCWAVVVIMIIASIILGMLD
jgi:hypothetical protein